MKIRNTLALLAVAGILAGTGIALAKTTTSVGVSASASSSWDGSSRTLWEEKLIQGDTTYNVIKTPAQLAYLATDSASWTGHYILGADLDLGNQNWTPIAENKDTKSEAWVYFSGIFDGNGHTITNLTINQTYDNSSSAVYKWAFSGLFGGNKGTIKNLNLQNVSLTVKGNVTDLYAGGLCGCNEGTITHISIANFTGSLNGTYKTGAYASSLVGAGYGDAIGAAVGYNNAGTLSEVAYLSGSSSATSAHHWTLVGYLPYSSDIHNGTLVGYNKTSDNITNAYVSSSCSTSNSYATSDGSSSGTTTNLADLVSATSATTGTFLDNALAFDESGLLKKNAPAYLADLLACDTCSEYAEAANFRSAYNADRAVASLFDSTAYAYDARGNATTAYTATNKLLYMESLASKATQARSLSDLGTTDTEGVVFVVALSSLALLAAGSYLFLRHRQRA
jgi:hypothetical protein